ncbi:TBC1 domain family member 13 [Trichinella murrelli]|uniref:TBC1 domain family member 13 n=1 Tax=Trichinella murrelli TaxID=144512 RepID=A0A0V0TK39_9BILA|nr:TBC1 domain family member 13 [Trichinella murrelli]
MEMLDDIDLNWTLESDSSNFRLLSFAEFAKDSTSSTPQDSFNFNTVNSFFTDSDDSGVNFGDNDQSPFSLPHEIRGLRTPEPACDSNNVLSFESNSNQHRHSATDFFAENLNGHVAEPSLQSAGNVYTPTNSVIVLATAYPPSNNQTKRYLPLKPKSESPSVLPVDSSSSMSKVEQNKMRNRESSRQFRLRRKDYVTSLEAKISKLENENLLLKRENDALKSTVSNLLFEMENLKLELASRLESTSTVTLNESPKRRKDAVFVAVLLLMFTFNLSPAYFSSFTGKNTGAFDEQLHLHLISSRMSDANLKKRSHGNFPDRVNRTKREILNQGEETASSYPCKSDSFLNKTETFRLTMELNRWANRHQYNKKSDKKQGTKSRVQRAKSRVKNRSTDAIFAFKHDKKSLKLKKMFSNGKMNWNYLKAVDWSHVLSALNRRNDTFYVVSLFKDYFVVPAASYNRTTRPRISLLAPFMPFDDSVPVSFENIAMLQIECEVMNTQLLNLRDLFSKSAPPTQLYSQAKNNNSLAPPIECFRQILDQDRIDLKLLREACFCGIPDESELRPICWRLLLNYLPIEKVKWPEYLKNQRKLYADLVEDIVIKWNSILDTDEHSCDHPLSAEPNSVWSQYFRDNEVLVQINKDVRRLCPEMSFFQKITQYPCQAIVKNGALALSQRVLTSTLRAEHLRNHRSGANNLVEDCSKRGNDDYFTIDKGKETHWQVVERILFIYSKLNPGVKYVQGMNEIVGPIYFVFASDSQWQEHAEADTFFCFQNLMSEIKDNFIKTLDSSNVGIDHQMRALYSLLQRVDPVLHQAMTEVQQLCPQYFAFRWLSLLLSQEFLLPDVIRLWDTLFADCRRFEFLLYVCLAMLILVRNDILTNEFSVNVRMLQNYPPIDIVSVIKLASEIRAVMEDRHPCVQGKLNLPLPESKAMKSDVYPQKEQHHIGHKMMKLTEEICSGCGNLIYDRYLLQVNQQLWHVNCLRCSSCTALLDKLPSCYLKEDKVFCKMCYQRQFSVKCDRCNQVIQSNHWVRRARQYVYHLACFACDSCQRQLSTGEEFALQDSRVLCKQHYMELLEGDNGKVHHKQKTKRVRTTFTEEQLQILQANFQIDSNPDGQDLERIAQGTGLSKRVTQNSRARQKKCQGVKAKSNSSHPNQSSQDSYDESSPSGPVSEPVTSHSIRSSPSQEDFSDLQYITDANEANVSMETDHIHMNAMFDSIDSVSSSVTNSPC